VWQGGKKGCCCMLKKKKGEKLIGIKLCFVYYCDVGKEKKAYVVDVV